MFIDSIWTQEIFGIIAWTQDDEMVVNDEMVLEVHATHGMHKGDHDETVQTVDKLLFHMIACTNNDVSMFVVVNDDLVGGHTQRKIDIRNRIGFQVEVLEQIDGLCSKLFQIHISQISHLQMMMWMNQFWFHGKIQHWKQVHQIHERKQLFVFQQQIFRQQLRIEHLLLKKRQKINMRQRRFQWVQRNEQYIISRRLQLHKMTQWLMCKLIQSRRNSFCQNINVLNIFEEIETIILILDEFQKSQQILKWNFDSKLQLLDKDIIFCEIIIKYKHDKLILKWIHEIIHETKQDFDHEFLHLIAFTVQMLWH